MSTIATSKTVGLIMVVNGLVYAGSYVSLPM
jgi:hypothetical protein